MAARKYLLVIEGDAGGYSAYVPELPSVLVTGRTVEELTARAKEAIRVYGEHARVERSAASQVREVEVEVLV